jgi:hypothetical protein
MQKAAQNGKALGAHQHRYNLLKASVLAYHAGEPSAAPHARNNRGVRNHVAKDFHEPTGLKIPRLAASFKCRLKPHGILSSHVSTHAKVGITRCLLSPLFLVVACASSPPPTASKGRLSASARDKWSASEGDCAIELTLDPNTIRISSAGCRGSCGARAYLKAEFPRAPAAEPIDTPRD